MSKNNLFLIVFLLFGVSIFFFIGTGAKYEAGNIIKDIKEKEVPQVTAKGWAVFDAESGEITLENEGSTTRTIASITKLFTAYSVLKSEKRGVETKILWSDLNTEGKAGKLSYGDTLTLQELLFPLLIESSNDAGTAIARVLGNEFQEETDSLITELGLINTSIVDSTGLSPENKSTPRDLAKLFSFLHKNHPFITDITRLNYHIEGERRLVNNSHVLSLDSYRGGKHGYLYESGLTFIGAFEIGSKEFGIVLLDSDDILEDVKKLIKYLENYH